MSRRTFLAREKNRSGVPPLQGRRSHFDSLTIAIYFVCAAVRSRSCVPLSKWTFFVAETIMDPCVALDAAESIERPSMPNTPVLLDASRPVEVNPPTAPVDRVAVFSVPPAVAGSELDVFITVPVAAPAVAPAVEATPPARPPEPRADPCAAPIPPPVAVILSAPAEASVADCAAARAWIEALKGTSWPFFNTA